MTSTIAATQANTFTEARAKEVMRNVHSDFMSWASAGFIDREKSQKWFEELEYAVVNDVVETFQIQLKTPGQSPIGLSYAIRNDGSILEESKGGGFDPYSVPQGTKFSVCFRYRQGAKNIELVNAYLNKRGWTNTGTLLDGGTRDRAFSKNGYGIERSKLGEW